MRISDWSSDVCSSDLRHLAGHAQSLVQPTERATACRRRPGDVAAGTCLGDPSRRWRCRRRVLARCPFRAGTGPADGVVPDVVPAPAEPETRVIGTTSGLLAIQGNGPGNGKRTRDLQPLTPTSYALLRCK